MINLQQNSPKWYEYRRTRIGASDFNYFCKHKGLYTPYYKVRKDDNLENHFHNKINNIWVDNPYMARGRELEPQLLEEYNKLTGGCFVPTVGQYEGNSDVFASFDGYDVFTNRIVEIKTTSKGLEFEKQLLESYVYQCIHQMKVADISSMVILINYYNYGITRYYLIKQDYDVDVMTYLEWNIYYLDNLLLNLGGSINWCTSVEQSKKHNIPIGLCTEYLQLLKEATNNEKI